jgi:Golgi phosphoprotein 3 (GPP34)
MIAGEGMIVEDLLQLMLDDESGGLLADATRLDYGLAGAVLIELALLERIVVEPSKRPADGVVRVVGAATDVPVLDAALARIAEKPRKAVTLVPRLAKGLRASVTEGLVASGVLREQEARLLGIFPRRRWPAVDPTAEDAVRRRLHGVLVQGSTPDVRTAALVSLLSAMERAPQVVGAPDRAARKQVKQRATVIAEGDWAGAAVRSAVQAAQAAASAAIIAASVAATSTST